MSRLRGHRCTNSETLDNRDGTANTNALVRLFLVGRYRFCVHSTAAAAARFRGGFVGALSAAVAVAAHGWAGGGVPSQSSATVLVFVSIAIGAAAAVHTNASTVSRLTMYCALGQVVTHFALVLSPEQMPGMQHGMQVSPAMLTGHLLAAVICAVLVVGAERMFLLVVNRLDQLVVVFVVDTDVDLPLALVRHDVRAMERVWVRCGLGTRGPPAPAVAA